MAGPERSPGSARNQRKPRSMAWVGDVFRDGREVVMESYYDRRFETGKLQKYTQQWPEFSKELRRRRLPIGETWPL